MRIVGMDECIDDDFTEDLDRDAPDVLAANLGKIRAAHGVLFQK